jgi:hypothetical protein
MIRISVAILLALSASLGTGFAQHAQPYAGLQNRVVKALSEQQMADLRAGRGMGLALAAELNGYPGPLHVIELRRELALNDAQAARVQALFDAMKAETIPLGEKLIFEETLLDGQFASRSITPAGLDAMTLRIGEAQAKLRAAHLRYHLAMLEVLSPEQIARYGEMRGYAARHDAPAHHRRH